MKIINVILFCFVLTNIHGQSAIEINEGDKKIVGKQMQYFVDTTNALTLDDVIDRPFSPITTDVLNLSFIPHTGWVRLKVKSATEQSIYLEIDQALLEELELYEVDESGGQNQLFSGGFSKRFDERPIKSENWLFDIPLENNTEKTIYIKGRTGYPFQIPVTLSSKTTYLEANQKYKIFWGIYMGIMIFAFLYNLFLFISLRERTIFYYLLYIIGSTVFYLGLYGYTSRYLWPDSPGLTPLLPVIICLTNIAITLFTLAFLKITKAQKVPYYGAWVLIIGFGLIAVLNVVGPYGAAIGLSQMFSLVAAIFFIYLGIVSLRRKVPTAKFYLIAWTIYLVLVILFLLTDSNVIESSFFTKHCILFGHMTEVILLSFALADRINWLKKDNEAKQEEIILQLEKNEKIQLKANQQLEIKVKERTAEVVEQRNKALLQKERSDNLLLNILPEETAEELKATGKASAKYFDSVTVIFADVKDFTKKAEKLEPTELVRQINELFTAFDGIVGKFNIEKIKTIGDAYMAVGGLPSINDTHPEDAIKAAIEFQKAVADLQKNSTSNGKDQFTVRVGIHTGPVVAGVVGMKKFAYDLWGNTVNIASRLENTSDEGKINVSQRTYELAKDKFKFIARGQVEAKNLGAINMYYVDN